MGRCARLIILIAQVCLAFTVRENQTLCTMNKAI
jgi:hypothetical protein